MKTTFNETGMQTIPRKEANRKIPTGSTWKGKINKKEGKKNTVLCADWFWRPSFTRGPYPSITAFTQLAAAAREKKENKTRNRRRAKTTPGAQLSLLSFSLTDSHHHHQGLINQSNTFRFPILSLSLSLSLSQILQQNKNSLVEWGRREYEETTERKKILAPTRKKWSKFCDGDVFCNIDNRFKNRQQEQQQLKFL